MKWANAIGKTARIDLLDARLPQNLQSVKKKKKKKTVSAQSTKAEHNKIKYA